MIELVHVSKTYQTADGEVAALKDVTVSVPDGDIFGIIGLSGAGKSTLVRCINLLERPDKGQILVDGTDMLKLSDKELRLMRRKITMIFQGFNLLMQRSVLKNVCFPLELSGMKRDAAEDRAKELLSLVGLKDKYNAFPAQLSGGQQQRVAIARALATNPQVLLCDEATSALDPTTTEAILNLIREINKKLGITVIIITHQMSVVESICNHVAIIDDGAIAEAGEVSEVFSHPKTAAAKRLVLPGNDVQTVFSGKTGERLIRVVFNGSNTVEEPMIAKLALDCGIIASIIYASTRRIGEATYGSMLLGIDGQDETVNRAIAYFCRAENIYAEEVSGNA